MKRRSFLAGIGAMGTWSLASPTIANVTLGSATLTTVSDGNLVLPVDFLFDPATAAEVSGILADYGVAGEQLKPECNLALYRDGTNTVLFDAGSGADFMPSAGKLVESLEAIDLAPEDITHVVFTHAHPDHIWGVLDDFDDPLFYEATYLMGRAEWDYWWNPATVDEIGDARAAFAVGAKRRMEAIEDVTEFFDAGDEVLPGIAAVASHGHTPGHMSFEVRQGSEAALIVGDAIGNHHVAFERPELPSGSDQDADTAIKSRLQLLDREAKEQMRIVGFHLLAGGIGHAEPNGDNYRFIPEAS